MTDQTAIKPRGKTVFYYSARVGRFSGGVQSREALVEPDGDVWLEDTTTGLWTRCYGISDEDLEAIREAPAYATVVQRHPLLQRWCREVLAALRGGMALRSRFRPYVIEILLARGLVDETCGGYIEPRPSAAGYCAAPSTFEI